MTYEEFNKGCFEEAKRLYKTANADQRYVLENLFPELAESEDEKTRKELIKIAKLASLRGDSIFGEKWDYKKWIAWLEKQGEKSLTVDIESMIEAYEQRLISQGNGVRNSPIVNMCVAAFKHGVENTMDELHLKQGEPSIKWNKNTEGNKPQVNHSVLMKTFQGIAEGEWHGEYWEQYRWAGIIKDSDVLSWMELSDLDKQGEQKPAWSEEDENYLNTTIAYLKDANEFKKTAENCINWLKNLKQRMGGKL